jgi:hypothetical protein
MPARLNIVTGATTTWTGFTWLCRCDAGIGGGIELSPGA